MKTSKFISVLLTVMIAVSAFTFTAIAEIKDTSKDVSLTIYALEAAEGSEVTVDESTTGEKVTITDKKPISGVSFNLYKVSSEETSTAIPSSSISFTTDKTGSDGAVTIVIPASEQGRYLVVENEKPNFAKGATVPFLVDLPMTNPQGTGFLYDVFVYPKQLTEQGTDHTDTDTEIPTPPNSDTDTDVEVKIIVGEIDGYKHDKDNKPLEGAEFTLYYDKSCKNEIAKTTSDKEGHFYFRGLADGTYYVKETKAPNGYQANTNIFEVKIDLGKSQKSVKLDVLNVLKPNLPVTGGAGIIGISVIGFSIAVLGAFIIYIALKIRKREKYVLA